MPDDSDVKRRHDDPDDARMAEWTAANSGWTPQGQRQLAAWRTFRNRAAEIGVSTDQFIDACRRVRRIEPVTPDEWLAAASEVLLRATCNAPLSPTDETDPPPWPA